MNTETTFDAPLISFLGNLRAIEKTVSVVIPHLSKWITTETESFAKDFQELAKKIESQDAADPEDQAKLLELHDKLSEFSHLDQRSVIYESLFTQIFSKFDAFTGDLIKVINRKNPDLFISASRNITIQDVKKFHSIEEILENELLQEIENFRRKSYADQFSGFEQKFNITLTEFDEWPIFIEASQRRNLIIHNNGVVNQQYIQNCKAAYKDKSKSAHLDKIDKSHKLSIGPKEFRNALIVMKKVAFMLTHTLWRKLFASEVEIAHRSCNELIFDYLCRELWHAAAEFGSFAITKNMVVGIDETKLKLRTINLAIAYKFSGQNEKCLSLINSIDWSTSNRDFRLAVEILKENKAAGIELMKKIGPEGDYLSEISYRSWPLFHKFREDEDFIKTFEEIYNKKFFKEVLPAPSLSENERSIVTSTSITDSERDNPSVQHENITIDTDSDVNVENNDDCTEITTLTEAAAAVEAAKVLEVAAALEEATSSKGES